MKYFFLALVVSLLWMGGHYRQKDSTPRLQVVQLGKDIRPFKALQKAFQANNKGYQLHFFSQVNHLKSSPSNRIAFVQRGGGTAQLKGTTSKVAIGDILLIPAKQTVKVDSLLDMLVFTVPEAFPDNLPLFIRPDWDEHITDTPGGCATETGAYRRILLTWLGRVGPYLYHSLNAHRVRIMDSFTHYHPKEGGFDEFYLVQMAMPGAKIITGERLDLVENYEYLSREQTKGLLTETPLHVGDLVYLPRGVIHRGLGGALVQVITVPGFIPKSEIGVDYYLRKINERFELKGEEALPYNVEASDSVVIK
jgi:quercetin dioxygenase-like cupin family protein